MRNRFYILFVARDAEGQLRKIPIPIHYLYVFMVGALIGMFTITDVPVAQAGSASGLLSTTGQIAVRACLGRFCSTCCC